MPYNTNVNLVNGVLVTTTSAGYMIGDRTKISIHYLVSAITAGFVTIKTQISNNNRNWTDYNRLVSNVAAGTAFTTATVRSTQNNIAFVPGEDTFNYMRAVVATGNGTGAIVTVILVGVVPGQ